MKRYIIKVLSLLCFICCLSQVAFSSSVLYASGATKSSGGNSEELDELIENNKFNGEIYKNSGSVASSQWKDGSLDLDYETDVDDFWAYNNKYWFAPKSVSGSGKGFWIQWSGNMWYFVISTEPVKYTDDSDRTKSISGAHAITEWLQDGYYLIDGKIYEFREDGLCLHNGNPAFPNVEFNQSTGEVKSGYTSSVSLDELDLETYTKEDWDGKVGTLDKESNEKLKNGYFIQDNENGKFTLYFANASGDTSAKKTGTEAEIASYISSTLKGNVNSASISGSSTSNSSSSSSSSSSTKNATFGSQYTLSFANNGGKGTMNSVKVSKGSKYTLPNCSFTKTGYVFNGWKCGDKIYKSGESITVNQNMSFTVVWLSSSSSSSSSSSNSGSVKDEIRSIISEIDSLKARLNSLLSRVD